MRRVQSRERGAQETLPLLRCEVCKGKGWLYYRATNGKTYRATCFNCK